MPEVEKEYIIQQDNDVLLINGQELKRKFREFNIKYG